MVGEHGKVAEVGRRRDVGRAVAVAVAGREPARATSVEVGGDLVELLRTDKNVSIEEILDWVLPEYVTKRATMNVAGVPRFVFTTELVAHAPDQTDPRLITWRDRAQPRTGPSLRRCGTRFGRC